MGLRLQLRKQQAEAGDIVLLYGDESEALTHPYLARAWAKSGADLRVPAPGQAKKVAMLGSLDHVTRQLIVHTSPTKRSSDFIAHLEQLDRLFGPQPGRQAKPVVLVEDNGPIHTSKRSLAALAARAHWLTVEWLPKYAPELNEIEPVWRDLKAHHLAHQTFTDVAALDQAIHDAVIDLNRERIPDPLAMPQNLCLDLRGLLRRLDLLFHRLESGGEHGSGQLGYLAAIADSGFDAVLDQLLLQFYELCRAFHCGKCLNCGSQILGVLSCQFLIRLGQLLNSCSRGVAAFGQTLSAPFMIVSAAWPLLVSASALVLAIFSIVRLVMTGYPSEMRAGFDPPPYGRKIDVVIGSENTHAAPQQA